MIYDEPRFLPGGDRFLLVELGNEMSLDLNFLAHGLAHAIAAERVTGVIETAPAYASLLVHYDPGDVGELVRIHAASEYWVAAIGWWPGVPFMMPLDPRCKLTAPRYNPPRLWTKKGTVGVGGGTTGIYPEDLPGGIQIFARIPVPIWDRDRRFPIFEDSICLLRPGDRVKFIPCELDEFEAVERMVDEATYPFNVVEYQAFSVPRYRAWLNTIDVGQRF